MGASDAIKNCVDACARVYKNRNMISGYRTEITTWESLYPNEAKRKYVKNLYEECTKLKLLGSFESKPDWASNPIFICERKAYVSPETIAEAWFEYNFGPLDEDDEIFKYYEDNPPSLDFLSDYFSNNPPRVYYNVKLKYPIPGEVTGTIDLYLTPIRAVERINVTLTMGKD